MQLYLCEKPSQAKDIARVLGISKRGQGFISGGNITVTWAIGHLLEQAGPDAYGEQFGKPWRVDVLPVLPDNWKMVVKPQTRDQFTVISKLLKQAGEVIIATDADREGEVIARELLAYCGYRGAVRRLWLSALDEASVREALAGILPGEKTVKLYDAGLGRSRADWLIGMNLTRLYTLIARAGVSDVLSVGRVQTPTLAIVVKRDKEIADFVPVPWWQVQALLEKDGVRFRVTWQAAAQYCDDEKRCVNQQAAKAVGQLCQQKGATVLEVSQKRDKTPAPLCFDLGTLQQVCSRKFGMGAKETLAVAQSLYETHKATTYPRTDCGYLPTSMQQEIPEVLTAVAKSDPSVAPVLTRLDRGFVSRVWNDQKITAHHAIIPTRQAFDLSRLSADELKVYQLIRQHYFAQFLPLQVSDVIDASFNIGGQLFRARGKVNVVTGWKLLFQNGPQGDQSEDDSDNDADMALPPLNKGDSCIVSGAVVEDKKTSPPPPFTEGTLIAAMKNAASFVSDTKLKKVLRDNAGLGTEATRAGVLETLFARHYLEKKGKNIHATLLARELIAALPETLTSPGMTALWEQALDDIAQGKMPLDTFMQKQLQWTRHLVDKGRSDTVKITAPVTPPCPVCKGLTRKRKGKNGDFWGCIRYPECNGVVAGKSGGKGRKRVRSKKTAAKTKVEFSVRQ
ncbi:TPA: DNA topoisomerase III [Enterobacter cloacae]|nr:DNA topoisomerase III [Enterobacter cloacae]